MIKVRFEADKAKNSLCMTAIGHAGSGEAGKDIICAGISTLAFTLAQCMEFMFSEGQLEKKPRIRIREGEMLVRAKPKAESYAEALHTFYVAEVGAHLIAANYPQYVTVTPFDNAEI